MRRKRCPVCGDLPEYCCSGDKIGFYGHFLECPRHRCRLRTQYYDHPDKALQAWNERLALCYAGKLADLKPKRKS
jgi:hypothetical protein